MRDWTLRPRDLAHAPGLILVAAIAAFAVFLDIYGDRLMPRFALAFAALTGLILLAGCQSTGARVLENLESCNRRYDGAISAGITGARFTGTIKVECLNADLERARVTGAVAVETP